VHEILHDLKPGGVRGISGVGAKSYNPGKTISAKASNWNGLDSEERKLGEQTGLDTRVVPAVNDAD